jgi:hypothetical protein
VEALQLAARLKAGTAAQVDGLIAAAGAAAREHEEALADRPGPPGG